MPNPTPCPELLEVRRLGVQVRPRKAYQQHLSVDGILRKELSPPVLELADLGRVHDAVLAVCPVEPPLVRFWIVEAHWRCDGTANRNPTTALDNYDCTTVPLAAVLDGSLR
jgi:hypothetical protein